MTVAMGILVVLSVGGLARFLLAGRPDEPEFVQRLPDGSVPDLDAGPQRVPVAAAAAREEPARSSSGTDASDLVRAGASVALKDGDVARATAAEADDPTEAGAGQSEAGADEAAAESEAGADEPAAESEAGADEAAAESEAGADEPESESEANADDATDADGQDDDATAKAE